MDKNSGTVYKNMDQMKVRKIKLEKMRKERELLQLEKSKREKANQENLKEIQIQNEIREKATKINDLEICKIQQEIDALNKTTTASQVLVEASQTNQNETSAIRSRKKTSKLTCSPLQITEISPEQLKTFSKHTQTDISRLNIRNTEPKTYDEYLEEDIPSLRLFCNFSSNLPPGILSPGLPRVMDIPPALTPIDKENPWLPFKARNKKISESQCEEMINSRNFQKSLKRVSLTMEKLLSNNKNICIDYIGDAEGYKINDTYSKESLRLSQEFYKENLTKNRCITCIDWSTNYSDRIAAAYSKNEESTVDVGEDVLIWNQGSASKIPEHILHCHSSVTSLCFAKFSPELILGATYSGQIVVWDNRVKTSIPVQCTKLNYKAHTQPIYCLREIGCESSHNMMTISTDGKLCAWNLDMLNQPTDVLQLELNVSDKIKKPICVTCMDLPANGRNGLILGAEDGCAYSAFRYGFESGINNRFDIHQAPVTSISSHYNQNSTDFGNLFLTSSMDCVVKLWSLEKTNALYTFKNNYDYVMNVEWSPIHPSVFIAGDGSGCMDLYNLNENFEEPITSVNTKDQIGINRIAWNSSGHYVAAGTENGKLYLYKIGEELANPSNEAWCSFKEIVHGLSINYGIELKD